MNEVVVEVTNDPIVRDSSRQSPPNERKLAKKNQQRNLRRANRKKKLESTSFHRRTQPQYR